MRVESNANAMSDADVLVFTRLATLRLLCEPVKFGRTGNRIGHGVQAVDYDRWRGDGAPNGRRPERRRGFQRVTNVVRGPSEHSIYSRTRDGQLRSRDRQTEDGAAVSFAAKFRCSVKRVSNEQQTRRRN